MEWRERIVCDPGLLGGRPSIKGTRLAVELILGWLAHDWSQQRLLDAYPQLTPEDIAAALAFAAESLHPDDTDEASQVAAAMRRYGVRPAPGDA